MRPNGFTLSELLIALVILGLIATFTIPKVLSSQASSQWNSTAKEALSTISGAYQAYKINNTPTGATTPGVLSNYMNYVKLQTTGTLTSGQTCGGLEVCLVLHNGGVLELDGDHSFGNTYSTNAWLFHFDPDGGGNPADEIELILYFDGRITSSGDILPGTEIDTGPYAGWGGDPSWFSWN